MKFNQRKGLPRWLKPGWGELAQEGGREGWVLGAGPMNDPGAPSPDCSPLEVWTVSGPGGSGFIMCREPSLVLTLGYVRLFHLLGFMPFHRGFWGLWATLGKVLWGFYDIYQFQLSPALVSL